MSIYRVWGPKAEGEYSVNAFRTSWHTSKENAWKEAKRKTGKKKSELKALGYYKESVTDGKDGAGWGDEQMILQGR